jgi:YYY domain-containing protein
MTDLIADSAGEQIAPPHAASRFRVRLPADTLVYAGLALVLIFAFAFRLYHVNWDDNQHLHPDERHMTLTANAIKLSSDPIAYFETDTSTMNPYNVEVPSFVYGTLPLFSVKVAASWLGYDNYDQLVLVGRYFSAIVDGLTVIFAFLLARRLFGSTAGIIAALLYATAPLAIQHAHFWVTDPFLTFFVTAGLFFCARAAQEGRRLDYALAGLALGMGLASKLTALTLAPIIGTAAIVQLWPVLEAWRKERAFRVDLVYGPLTGLITAALVAFIAFRVFQPYAFDQPQASDPGSFFSLNHQWVQDQKTQADLLSGKVSFPPSVQWIGRESYLYPIVQMIDAGMGPVFGVLGWLAFAFSLYRLGFKRDFRALIPALLVLLYFGFMGRQFSLYLRYFLPLYPALAVLAAYMLVEALGYFGRTRMKWHLPVGEIGRTLVAVLLVAATLPGLAYLSIYSKPVTRIAASEWMSERWPVGTKVGAEHWDDTLPLRLPNTPDKQVQFVELALYETDTQEKVDTLISRLDQVDYVVLSSNRLLASIPRNPVNYPVTSRYYDLLLSEQLGFELEQKFTSPPTLFGIAFPDNQTEESWSSYDHPQVLIFKKTAEYSHAKVEQLLGTVPVATFGLSPAQADKNGLLLRPADFETQQKGGTWTRIFSSSGIAHTNPTLVWLLAIQGMALAALPLSLTVFRRLPDRGYLLAKPLGLLLLGYPVWLVVSLKLVHFEQSTLLVMLALLFFVSSAVLVRNAREIGGFIKSNWRLILFCEVVFFAAFFFSREVRMLNPDLWHPARGGEKPMDLAYFTAVTRSTTLPPYDPWFAGGYINYYYLGQFFSAVITKLTTVPPEIAYNLVVPTYFALTVGGAFSIAYNLAAFSRRLMRRRPGFRRLPSWSLYFAGLLGAFLVALAGNLDAYGQLSDRLSLVSGYHLTTGLPIFDSIVNSAGGLWQVLFHGAAIQQFDFWRPSRMMPPQISITEFPEFSFLFADLHAHMIAIPFEVFAIAVAAALCLGPRGERSHWREWSLVVLMALVVGSLRWINSWDYPPFMLIAGASLLISERRVEGGFLQASLRLAAKVVLLVALSYLFYKPFSDNYVAPVAGLEATPDVTPPHQYAAHFGVFLFLIGAWLLYSLSRVWKSSPLGILPKMFANGPEGIEAQERFIKKQVWLAFALGIAGATVILSLGLYAQGKELIALILPVLVYVAFLAAREFRLQRADGGLKLFLLMLVGLGLGLSAGVDLVVIKGDIERMNTVFKFYLHIWVVFAIVSSFAAWYLLFVAWRPKRKVSAAGFLVPALAKGALAILLFGALLYPLLATPARVDDRFNGLAPTLDGEAFMSEAVYHDQHGDIDLSKDLEGIEWMRANVQGTPTIVEGRTDLYRWGSRFSIYTGLPTVLGWDWHQTQQRGELAFLVDQRKQAVDNFYTSTSINDALKFLQQYQVKYVIVGEVEKLYYPEIGLLKFDNGLNGRLTKVFSNSDLSIYEVSSTSAIVAGENGFALTSP